MPYLFHIGIEERGRQKDQNENMASKNGAFSFCKNVNNFVGKELNIDSILCWRGNP